MDDSNNRAQDQYTPADQDQTQTHHLDIRPMNIQDDGGDDSESSDQRGEEAQLATDDPARQGEDHQKIDNNYQNQRKQSVEVSAREVGQESRQLSSVASFGQIYSANPTIICHQIQVGQEKTQTDPVNNLGLLNYLAYLPPVDNSIHEGRQDSRIQKSSSLSKDQSKNDSFQMPHSMPAHHNTNRQVSNIILQSPNHTNDNHLKPPSLFLSANSKKSTSNSGLGKIPNNFTMRSLKSQNSIGTGGSHTNRADSYLQKSPHTHMSDLQDPYAYFNMHQQKQNCVNAAVPIINRMHTKQTAQNSHDQQELKQLEQQHLSGKADFLPIFGNQVKSCRTNLYCKPQIISQRSGAMQMIGVQGKLVPQPQNILEIQKTQSSKNDNSSGQGDGKSGTMSDTTKLAQAYLSQAEEPFVLNQNQIKFNNQSGFNNASRKNSSTNKNEEAPPVYLANKHPVSAKTKFGGIQKSGGSGSRGSNFNSSTSTFPAAPVSKLSDVKNPQKLMTFRFVNQKATKITEISQFKNLQDLDLSGNMLQEQVKELSCLSFLKRLSLCNNKITDMWILPSSLEIVNLSLNFIKKLPIETCKKLKNVTTLDIQSNKLETLENFEHLQRLKRLLAKNNFIRDLMPLQGIKHIFEIDLESNGVDSHIDFVKLIKGKSDLIVFNLSHNPLMVETETIEKFNDDLIQKATQYVTQKTSQEIQDTLELLGTAKNERHSEPKEYETQRFSLHLVEELAETLSFLKAGVLYRNKRVYNKLKAVCMRQHRLASDISNYSHHDLSAKLTHKAPFNQVSQRQSKEIGSNQDKNSVNLTPQSENKKAHLKLDPSSQPREVKKKQLPVSQSLMFSPVADIKSKRYEDVECIYDCIVEQEELKRLKREKILAKRKQQKKKLMMSQLDGAQSEYSDSENNSSQFFDDDIDDSEDLSLDDTHDMIEPREDFDYEDLMEHGNSQIIDYANQRLHDDEVASQTFTSDLDAELHSYKKDGQDFSYNHEKLDEGEYLNGSTAGFGKKLREINREINQEQKEAEEDAYSNAKGDLNCESVQKAKLRGRFDLNLDQIKVTHKEKHLQSDLKKSIKNVSRDGAGEYQIDDFCVQQFNIIKQTKTTQNSNENSQCGDISPDPPGQGPNRTDEQNQLNQSFSIRNLQNQFFQANNENIEVESLMMNKQIQGIANAEGGGQQHSSTYNIMEAGHQQVPLNQIKQAKTVEELKENNPKVKATNMGQSESNKNLMLNTESMSFKLQQSNTQNVNQSLNHSLLNNSMAQSIQSVTQTSKKTLIANFKLDLSKCKQDQIEDDFVHGFDESRSPQTSQSNNLLSSIVKQDQNSSLNHSMDEDSKIRMEDIVLTYNDAETNNIENMLIDVDQDSFRNQPHFAHKPKVEAVVQSAKGQGEKIPSGAEKNNVQEKQAVVEGNKTERDPTPAPVKLRTSKRGPITQSAAAGEEPKKLVACSNCKKLEQKLATVTQEYKQDLDEIHNHIKIYQEVFRKLKQKLNLIGEIDFSIPPPKSSKSQGKRVIKLSNFADLVLLSFKRMYTDLEHQKYYNNNLENKIKHQQQQLNEAIDRYNQLHRPYVIQSLTNRSIVHSVDLTDHGTPESIGYQTSMAGLQLNSYNPSALQKEQIIPKVNSKLQKIHSGKPKNKDKEILKIKMQDMRQAQVSQQSESSYSDACDADQQSDTIKRPQSKTRGQSKKKSAKTVRTLPLSSKDIKASKKQNRVNSNPKFSVQEKAANNYVANTFSSNYSLQNQHKNSTAVQAQPILEEDVSPLQDSLAENSGVLLNQFSQNSQLHILPNSYQVKVLPCHGLSTDQNPILLQNNLINFQSNTSRSGGKILTGKKVKSPVMHHVQKNFEHTPNNMNLSYSNKKQRIQNIEMLRDRELSSEIHQGHQNYKTSRMPVTSSLAFMDLGYSHENTAENDQLLHQHLLNCENLLADTNSPHLDLMMSENAHQQFFSQQINNSTQNFSGNYINSSQIKSEKRQKPSQAGSGTGGNQSVKQSFKTQRKMTQGRNLLNPTSGVNSQRPVDSKTQRIQRQIMSKSGAANLQNFINLQQTYDHNVKKSSINAVFGLSNTATDTNSLQQTKRPQSVAERGRNVISRKSQKGNFINNQQNSKLNMKNQNGKGSSKAKYKSKSTERKNSRQGIAIIQNIQRDTVMSIKQVAAPPQSAIKTLIDQQVTNLQVNIQNIQMVQNQKFSQPTKQPPSSKQDSLNTSDVSKSKPAAQKQVGKSQTQQERPYSSRTSRFSD